MDTRTLEKVSEISDMLYGGFIHHYVKFEENFCYLALDKGNILFQYVKHRNSIVPNYEVKLFNGDNFIFRDFRALKSYVLANLLTLK